MIKFHKKETAGCGANGETVNTHWIDISVHGEQAGYIVKSVGLTFFNVHISYDGIFEMNGFTSLKGAKDFARLKLNK